MKTFEISPDCNRVELNVGGYTLAVNAGDVYATDDVHELDAIAKNDWLVETEKPATRTFAPYEAPADDPSAYGAPPSAWVDPLDDKELKKARSSKADSGGNEAAR